jgi:hypothetical protein
VVTLALIILPLTGILMIVKRNEITSLQKAAIGARLHSGCAVAEGIVLILIAAVIALLHWRGWW